MRVLLTSMTIAIAASATSGLIVWHYASAKIDEENETRKIEQNLHAKAASEFAGDIQDLKDSGRVTKDYRPTPECVLREGHGRRRNGSAQA